MRRSRDIYFRKHRNTVHSSLPLCFSLATFTHILVPHPPSYPSFISIFVPYYSPNAHPKSLTSLTLFILTSSVSLKPGSPPTLPLLALLTSPLPATLSSASHPLSINLLSPHSYAPSAAELPSLSASPFLPSLYLLQPILVLTFPQSRSSFCLLS